MKLKNWREKLSPEERNNLEFTAIRSLITSDLFFDNALEKYSDLANIFKLSYHKDIIDSIFKLFKQLKRKPSLNDTLNYLTGELREHFKNHIIKSEYTHKDIIIDLIDDNVQSEAQMILAECQHLNGLEYVSEVQRSLLEILNNLGLHSKTEPNINRIEKVINEIDLIRSDKNYSRYIETGYGALDDKIIGFKKGGITIIAARPGNGKTTMALNFKENLRQRGLRSLFFSIEMASEDLTYKDLSYHSEINSKKIESGNLTDLEYQRVLEASEQLKGEDYIYIDDGSQTANKICSKVRQELLKGDISAVFIDYLTLLDMVGDANQHLAIENTIQIFRTFAKETDIPFIILSQLNRKVEDRPSKVPILADLRASGSIEEAAMQIIFLFRPHYYFPDANYPNDSLYCEDGRLLEAEQVIKLIIAKARGGDTGTVDLQYIKEIQKIKNVSIDDTHQMEVYENSSF